MPNLLRPYFQKLLYFFSSLEIEDTQGALLIPCSTKIEELHDQEVTIDELL